jgi:hypothetical protein
MTSNKNCLYYLIYFKQSFRIEIFKKKKTLQHSIYVTSHKHFKKVKNLFSHTISLKIDKSFA